MHEQVLKVLGDGLYAVQVDGKTTLKSVPTNHLAPRFNLDEKVMYTASAAPGAKGANKQVRLMRVLFFHWALLFFFVFVLPPCGRFVTRPHLY